MPWRSAGCCCSAAVPVTRAAGGAVGLIAGGLLVTYASWRWVLFVSVPIGIAAALAALAVLPGTARRAGRLGLPGAITATGPVAALVYGLPNAATSPDGTSHWGDGKVIAALTAGAVLLAAFAVVEMRSRHALLPVRLLRSRDRLGANLIMLGVGTAIFGVLYWLSRVTEHSTYAGGLLGPGLVLGPGSACCSSRCRWSPCPASPRRSPCSFSWSRPLRSASAALTWPAASAAGQRIGRHPVSALGVAGPP
jgi:MFS family permease